ITSDCRVVFNEITKDAIKESFKHPRPINQALVDAQQARRVLDRLVGYNISPLLWKKVKKGLSAGRVQSVAVRLIIDREKEIQSFEPEEYWTIKAGFLKGNEQFEGQFYGVNGKKIELKNVDEVKNILSQIDVNLSVKQDEVEAELSRSEEHTSELQSRENLVCRLLLEKKKHVRNNPNT